MRMSEVESRTGAVSTLRSLRLPSPLIKPDVRISRIRLSDRLHCRPTAAPRGRLRRAVQLPRKSSELRGVVRLIANHLSSTSSKARLKQGSFPPPALPGFSGTMTLSDSHRVRIAAAMEQKLHPNGSPTLPASPFRRAVPTTPADRTGAVDLLSRPYGLPRSRRVGIRNCTFEACSGFIRIRPTGSLDRPRRPLSRGFNPASCPATLLVSYQPVDFSLGGSFLHW